MSNRQDDTQPDVPTDVGETTGVEESDADEAITPVESEDGHGEEAPVTEAEGTVDDDRDSSGDDALAEAVRQRDEYLDALRRTQAEFQNYRKRAMREGTLERDKGVTDVLGRLVDVVDEFELAVLAADSADRENLKKGVEMVYGKLVDVLRSFGLEKIGQEGVPFDPEFHDAVQGVDAEEDLEEPLVAEVLRPGYVVGDRVLRPAMVKVRK